MQRIKSSENPRRISDRLLINSDYIVLVQPVGDKTAVYLAQPNIVLNILRRLLPRIARYMSLVVVVTDKYEKVRDKLSSMRFIEFTLALSEDAHKLDQRSLLLSSET